jgi:hypothetical protein
MSGSFDGRAHSGTPPAYNQNICLSEISHLPLPKRKELNASEMCAK